MGTKKKNGRTVPNCVPNSNEDVAEANPNQQASLWHPETRTYRGAKNKIPTSTSVDADDITARAQQVDFPGHSELARGADAENPEDAVYKNDLKRLVAQHFKSLPTNIREVLKLRFWDGMTLEQAAQRLGVSAALVRQLEAKGFRLLKHSSRLGNVHEEGNKIGHMDADKFDDAMARLKKLAGSGPMKTVWDPVKRVYKNVPVAQQPQDKK